MHDFITNPFYTFLVGLGVALLLAGYTWFNGVLRRRDLRGEVKALKEQLHRQMTIVDKGNAQTTKELEELRKQNENLRVTVATLKSKPGRAELHTLHVYDKAIRLMHKKAPGFAPAWEDVMAEAQSEADQIDNGLIGMVRKAFRPSLSVGSSKPALEAGEASEAEDDSAEQDDRGARSTSIG